MPKPGATGVTRLLNAYRASCAGLSACWRNEEAFRQEVLVAIAAVPLAYLLGNSALEFAVLLGSVVLVIVVELLNSAIESSVDRIGTEHHELSGRAKDMGSAAVLISSSIAAVIWLFVLIERLNS